MSSVGTFADRASSGHKKNIARQKKVLFGERPSDLSAESLIVMSAAMTSDQTL